MPAREWAPQQAAARLGAVLDQPAGGAGRAGRIRLAWIGAYAMAGVEPVA